MPKDRDAWQEQRREVIARAKGQCERCRMRRGQHVHHLRYAAVIGHEPLDWLLFVCLECHGHFHPRHTFLSIPEQRRRAAARKQQAKAKARRAPVCAHCGGTYSRQRHEDICVTYGLHRRHAEAPAAAPTAAST